MRRAGNSKPLLRMAARTRSRASRTARSPSPTIVNAGSPGRRSTSTVTRRLSTPCRANVVTWASMGGDARRADAPDLRALVTTSRSAAAAVAPERGARLRPRGIVTKRAPCVTPPAVASPAMSPDPRHHLGRLGEQLAAEHLERLGYAIVARHHRTRFGEIDLIATDGPALVFVEVKCRRGRGQPWDALHDAKRAQVRRMARAYLTEHPARPRVRLLRFDAIGVVVDARGRLTRLEHLEGAF